MGPTPAAAHHPIGSSQCHSSLRQADRVRILNRTLEASAELEVDQNSITVRIFAPWYIPHLVRKVKVVAVVGCGRCGC